MGRVAKKHYRHNLLPPSILINTVYKGVLNINFFLVDLGRHLNIMEGTLVEHKDHFTAISESLYLGHNPCQKYRDFTKEMT